MLSFITKHSKVGLRFSALAAGFTSLLAVFAMSPALAVTSLTISNSPSSSTNINAQNLADNLVFTSITLQSTGSITVSNPVDISSSTFGTPHFNLTLSAPVCNINNNMIMSAGGHLFLTCTTINWNGTITSGGTLISPSRVTSTATQANVLSNSASIQQAIDDSSQTSTPTVNVAAGNYSESLLINHPITLSGNDGTNPVGADPSAPTVNGVVPAGNVITVNSGGVEIDGLHLNGSVNGGVSTPSVNGVSLNNVNGFTAVHNTLDGFSGAAFNTGSSTNVLLSANAPADQTVTFMTPAPTDAVFAGPVYVPNAVSTSGLPVTITVDPSAASVCSIDGSGNVSFQAAGTCVLDADQPGNGLYNPAPQVQQSFTVNPADQTVAFTSTAPINAVVGGLNYQPTASATSGLTPVITVDSTATGVCSIDGSGNVSFQTVGTCVLDANQSGDGNYNAATQVQQTFMVNPAAIFVHISGSQVYGSSNPTFSFTSTPPNGVTVVGSLTCTTVNEGTPIDASLAVGSYILDAASCSGLSPSDANDYRLFYASSAGDFTVTPASQTVSFTTSAPTNATVGGAAYVPAASATSGLAATITVDSVASSVCSIDGSGNVSFQAAGTCVLDADQAGNVNFSPAPQVQQSFTVSQVSQTVAFTSAAPTNAVVGGATYTPVAAATSGLPATITVDPASAAVCSLAGGVVSFQHTGTCTLDANQAGNAEYSAAAQVQQSFAVNQVPVFVVNTPPTTATVGQVYTYVFAATGTPDPTYSLAAGAPAWLSINATTGQLSGTPPTGSTSFTYSVVASNSAGAVTTGPFTVTVSTPTTSTKADIAVTLKCTATAHVGNAVTCTVTVTNNGPATAKNVYAAVFLPSQLGNVTVSGGGKVFKHLAIWNVSSLASGASTTFTLNATAISKGTAVVTVLAFSSNPDPSFVNNVALGAIVIS